jgi:hypothetical protein
VCAGVPAVHGLADVLTDGHMHAVVSEVDHVYGQFSLTFRLCG